MWETILKSIRLNAKNKTFLWGKTDEYMQKKNISVSLILKTRMKKLVKKYVIYTLVFVQFDSICK